MLMRRSIMDRTVAIFLRGTRLEERQIEESKLRAEGIEQIAQAETPGFANSPVATREWNVPKMRAALKSGEIGHQKFAAPNLAVGAEARSIKGHADHFVGDPILGHATRDVRVMVLDADLLNIRHLQRQLGAEILRMQIVGDGAWARCGRAASCAPAFRGRRPAFRSFPDRRCAGSGRRNGPW